MKYINPCLARIPTGEHCPSEAHEKLKIGDKDMPVCSHHFRVLSAKVEYYRLVNLKEVQGYERELLPRN